MLFYGSFGFVVTSSVSIAGVLLVFCYLVVPSVAGMLFAKMIGKRLAIAWTMGTLVSALGIFLSVKLDLPTGAAIVVPRRRFYFTGGPQWLWKSRRHRYNCFQ